MAAQSLGIWAEVVTIDNQTNTPQRRMITLEEWRDGLLRDASFSAQQYNSIMNVLSSHSSPNSNSPYLLRTSEDVPDYALEMNGQSFLQADAPELYDIYTGTLDDMTTDAPAGYTYIIRIQ